MKKTAIFLFVAIALIACSPKTTAPQGASRGLEEPEWDALIDALIANNWAAAHALCERYLPRFAPNDTSGEAARFRYMYIYSLAGRVGERAVDREAALKKVKKFEGKRVEMPSHPIRPSDECVFNCFWRSEDDPAKIIVASAGGSGTFIHAFETFALPPGLDLEQNRGKNLRLGGTLTKIELRGQTLSAFGIEVSDCYYELEDE